MTVCFPRQLSPSIMESTVKEKNLLVFPLRSELQIIRGNENNLKIIFLISQQKHYVVTPH